MLAELNLPVDLIIAFWRVTNTILALPFFLVSGARQRQQTKWVVFGLASSILVMVIWGLSVTTVPGDQPSMQRVLFLLLTRPLILVLIPLLPVSMAFSILRYRLWDIDLIINKTLVYGALTGALALVYFMSVVLLQQVFPAESAISIVLSTPAIAALFTPLRSRMQKGIDKRFYRAKYAAQQTLATFSSRLRDEVELEQLTETLLAVINETMQPAQVPLWLREGKFERLEGWKVEDW